MPVSSKTKGSVIPSLRRAATVTLDPEDEPPTSGIKKVHTKKSISLASKSKAPSVPPKVVLVKESSGNATFAKELASGSHLGKTGSAATFDIDEECRKLSVPNRKLTTKSKASSAVEALKKAIGAIPVSPPPSLSKSISSSSSKSKTPSLKKSSSSLSRVITNQASDRPLMEIAFSFDTTGSMYRCLEEVRGRLTDIVQRLQADIPGIRIAIIAHGDYCDSNKYVIQWIDFGATLPELVDFIQNVERTSGGDADECYELVLERAREVLSWTPGSSRSLVIIGDSDPHSPGYVFDGITYEIDWRAEAAKLQEMNVRIYSVAIHYTGARKFYQTISAMTGGREIALTNFDDIFHIVMSISYREGGDDLFRAYESEVRGEFGGKGLGANLEGMFSALRTTGSVPIAASTEPPTGPNPRKILKAKRVLGRGQLGCKGLGTNSVKTTSSVPIAAPTKTPTGPKPKRITKAKKVVGKATKRTKTPKPKQVEKIKRENFSKMKEPSLRFGPWGLLTSKKKIFLPKGPVWWVTRSYADKGFVNRAAIENLYGNSIYEIAVQPPGQKQKYVVYFTAVSTFYGKMMWVDFVLKNQKARAQCRRVIQNGGTVYIRCAKVGDKKSLKEIEKCLDKKYSYLWRQLTKKDKLRIVKKKKFCLSHVV